jgi:hypothetical protein
MKETTLMSNSNLAMLRARMNEANKKTERVAGDGGSNFPFWNIPEGGVAVVRFLPDADVSNPFFWSEKHTISLPFDGILNGDPKPLTIKVPSMSTWNEKCAITEAIKPLWNSDRDTAKRYYRKKSFNYAGFVVTSPLPEDRVPENPIRKFALNQSIHDVIWAALMDAEMEEIPTEYSLGRDFRIIKTRKAEYANYSTSSFSMRQRALSPDELQAIDRFGLPNFSDMLGRKPDAAEQEAIFSMFEDSLAGKAYDVEKYGAYFKPWMPRDAANGNAAGAAPAVPVDHNKTLEMIRAIKR